MTRGRANVRVRALALAALVVLLVLGLDQLTKHLVFDGLGSGETERVLPGLVTFVKVENPGVAFGFLSGGGALVYVVTAAALLALFGFLVTRPGRPWLWLPTGMLIGGAISNLLDRLRLGDVRDFIKLPHWPAFNVADMSITLGVVVLLVVVELGRPERRGGGAAG